jgi:hypothetical protein
MHVFNLDEEQAWDTKHHVEKILGKIADGDVTVACWEPGQISPYHCHPDATEIYFCYQGGGKMRAPRQTISMWCRARSSCIRRANCTNMLMDRSALCYSASVMGPTCMPDISNGAGGRISSRNRRMPRISGTIRRAKVTGRSSTFREL